MIQKESDDCVVEPKQQPPYPLRMPPELRTQLEEDATRLKRSLNAEIVDRLQSSYGLSSDSRQVFDTNVRLQKENETLRLAIEAQQQVVRLLGYSLAEATTQEPKDSPAIKRFKQQIRNVAISLWNGNPRAAGVEASEIAFGPKGSSPS